MSYGAVNFKWVWFFIFLVTFDLEDQGQLPPNNRHLNQGLFAPLVQFGDPDLNGSQVIARTRVDTQTQGHTHAHTHTQTDTGNDNTRRPKFPSEKKCVLILHIQNHNHIIQGLMSYMLFSERHDSLVAWIEPSLSSQYRGHQQYNPKRWPHPFQKGFPTDWS